MNFIIKNYSWQLKKAPRIAKNLLIMKCICLFLLLGTLNSVANVMYSQKLSLHLDNVTIQEVLSEIEKSSAYCFTYNAKKINVSRKVSVNMENWEVKEILDEIFKGNNIGYTIKDNHIILYKNTEIPVPQTKNTQQQKKTVTGTVIDELNEPVIGANIMEKGAVNGTVTDIDGKFSLSVPDNAILQISYIGYNSKEVPVAGTNTLTIRLTEDTKILDEVIVIGYGTRDKRSLTSSLSNIRNKDIKDLKTSSMEQLIKGQAAGVMVTQSTGHPGAGVTIRVRGTGSINAQNDPLYVVDGMPIEPPGYNANVNILSFLNPNDVESITILKDAASTAIYGSRASNGVVIITTKSGKSGKTTVDFSAYYGIQQIPKQGRYEMMNAEEFARFRIEALQDQAKIDGVPFDPNTIPEGYRDVTGPGTDWYGIITRDVAPTQQYNITVSSGTEKSRLLVSGDYYSVDGIVKNSDYKRGSLRMNADVDIFSFVKLGVRVNPSYNFRNTGGSLEGAPFGSLLGLGLCASPISPAYLSDGSVNPTIGAAPENFLYPNPINVINGVTNSRNDFRLLSSANVDIKIIDGLYFKNVFGIDLNFSQSRMFWPSWAGTPSLHAVPGGSTAAPNATGESTRDEFRSFLIENYFTYNRIFNETHNIDLMLGHSAQRQDYDYVGATGTKFPDDKIPYVSAAIPGSTRDGAAGSDNFKYAIESYLARVNYTYADKYFLHATVRRDGTSRFSKSGRWGTFPSVSVGWNMAGESFMERFKFVDALKLRASYGITGNINIRQSFGYYPSMINANYYFNNNLAAGKYPGYVDQGLKWEKNKETDLGLDFSILNHRLGMTVDYYNRITYDLLLNRPTPSILGVSSSLTNIGKIENRGWEFSVNSVNVTNPSFEWRTNFNISFNKNKVLALNDNNDPIEYGSLYSGSIVTEIGKPIGMYKGFKINGVYRTEEEAGADHNHNPGAHAGTLRIEDVNNDGQITTADRTIIGNPHPKFIYGLSNTVTFKQIDFSLLINGSFGNKIFMSSYEFLRNMDGPFNVLKEVENRWRSPEQPGNGEIPTTNYSDQRQYVRLANSDWVKDGSYLGISNITLGYSLSPQVCKKIKFVKNARFYCTVQNAFMFSRFPLNNPEANVGGGTNLYMGWQQNPYPLARLITFGTNITF